MPYQSTSSQPYSSQTLAAWRSPLLTRDSTSAAVLNLTKNQTTPSLNLFLDKAGFDTGLHLIWSEPSLLTPAPSIETGGHTRTRHFARHR